MRSTPAKFTSVSLAPSNALASVRKVEARQVSAGKGFWNNCVHAVAKSYTFDVLAIFEKTSTGRHSINSNVFNIGVLEDVATAVDSPRNSHGSVSAIKSGILERLPADVVEVARREISQF